MRARSRTYDKETSGEFHKASAERYEGEVSRAASSGRIHPALALCLLLGYGTGDGDSLPKRLLYVSQCCNVSQVFVYDRDGKEQRPIARITSGITAALGLAVDRHGNLYVANDGNVLVFAPGATQPFRAVATNIGANYVAVASDGTIYAGGICSGCSDKIEVVPQRQPHTTFKNRRSRR